MRALWPLLLAGCTGGATPQVHACDLCSVYAAAEAQGEAGKGFLAGFATQFTHFGTLQSDGQTVPNDGEHLDSLRAQLFAAYHFNHRLGVQFNLPVIYHGYGRQFTAMDDGHVYAPAERSESGIGDASLLASYRVLQRIHDATMLTWTILGGLQVPTGDTGHLNPHEPDFATGIGGHDLTFGSGSIDGLVGTSVFLRWKRTFVAANLQYALRTEGDYDYRFANDLMWAGGPGLYLALGHTWSLSLQALVSGEQKGPDTQLGVQLDDTAATVVSLGPQLSFTWGSRLSAQLGVDIPVSLETTGNQIVPDYRLRGALSLRF